MRPPKLTLRLQRQTWQEHAASLLVSPVLIAKRNHGVSFFIAREPVVRPAEQGKHHERDERRPVDDAADEEQEEAGVLRMSDVPVEAGLDEFTFEIGRAHV